VKDLRKCRICGAPVEESVHCGVATELLIRAADRVRLSKLISGVLRHFPGKLGLTLDKEGFVSLEALAEAVRKREGYEWVRVEHIVALAQADPKGRFEISGGRIRARYGHSVPVRIRYPEAYPNALLYHGTSLSKLDSIMRRGLLPMRRRFVHLTAVFEDAAARARIHSDPVVLVIDPQTMKGRVKLFHAGKHVYVAPYVPPDSIVDVIRLCRNSAPTTGGPEGAQHG